MKTKNPKQFLSLKLVITQDKAYEKESSLTERLTEKEGKFISHQFIQYQFAPR